MEKCKPFYDLLKIDKRTVKWDQVCEDAFNKLKEVLTKLQPYTSL